MENNKLTQSALTVIAPDVNVMGTIEVSSEAHIYGKVEGDLKGRPGSLIIIKEGAFVEGSLFADTLIIDGFVKGQVHANKKVRVGALGKLIGNIRTPSLEVDPGAIFEAKVIKA